MMSDTAQIRSKHGWVHTYCFIWSLIIRLCMSYLPFKYYRRLLGEQQKKAIQDVTDEQLQQAERIKDIVEEVCKGTPWKSECMAQAIICKRLLKKKGLQTTIYLGVAKDDNNHQKLKAHAWLTLGQHVLTGAYGYKQYQVANFYS
ncbi:MAG: lasso peptide biosynthesis B2 protein [Bacteroidetes bacterium]|nr:lasso peptide biosynthesis B2 protein [Bacteroidota bacterium]